MGEISMRKIVLSIALTVLCIVSVCATTYHVTDAEDFNMRAKHLQAGDSIVIPSGIWRDAVLLVKNAHGTAEAPITVTVEEKGKTFLEGGSCIRFSGEYVIVEGLVFRNGSAEKTVIDFRTSSTQYANHSVVRECVVRDYNPADKTYQTTWVSLWGKYNEVANCYFGGKSNQGTTFIVWPNDSASTENHHRIHHNYFAYRRPLGRNGGETIRIGTSHVCKNNSQTIVEDNYFEHCSGEVEIISVKSCENILRRNTFYECEGSLVLRHGDRNEVYDNVFIGNNKRHTGGVRIINADHKVYNNLFYKLAGMDFRAALCIMNGIPNSAPNGYERVQNVVVENNTWVSCKSPIEFCNGKGSRGRDDKPVNTVLRKNIVFCPMSEMLIKEYDTDYNIRLEDNIMVDAQHRSDGRLKNVFWNDLYLPEAAGYGFTPAEDHILASAESCGPSWYQPGEEEQNAVVRTPKIWKVETGEDNLRKIAKKAQDGDVLVLSDGEHKQTKPIVLHRSLTIKAAEGTHPIITIESEANTVKMFDIGGKARIEIENIKMAGDVYVEHPAKYCFSVNKEDATHYMLLLENCEISGFNVEGGAVFKAAVNTFADTIVVKKSYIHHCYRGFALAEEKEEKGNYNAETVIFDHSKFEAITQWVLDYNRLGNDESTTGGTLRVDHCVFSEVNDRADQVMLRQKGIKHVCITNSVFMNSDCKNCFRLAGVNQTADNCCVYLCGTAKATGGAKLTNMTDKNPKRLRNIGL